MSTPALDKEIVRDAVDPVAFYESHLGLGKINGGGEIAFLCPFHADGKHPNWSVNGSTGLGYCQVCKIGGDVFWFVERLKKLEFPEALKYVAEWSGTSVTAPAKIVTTSKKQRDPLLDDPAGMDKYIGACGDALWSDRASGGPLDLLQTRRLLTPETLFEFRLGWDASKGRYVIPLIDARDPSGKIQGIKFYKLDPVGDEPKMYGLTGQALKTILYGKMGEATSRLWIAEGELDALALLSAGESAVTVCTGAGELTPHGGWNETFSSSLRGHPVIAAGDHDAAGAAYSKGVIGSARAVRLITWPADRPKGWDVTDELRANGIEGLQQLVTDPSAPRSEDRGRAAAALQNYIVTIKRYQYVPDSNGISFVLGVYAANHLEGDPVWGLAVGAAGSGKTESIMPLTAMPDVFAASTMTEASLLSGTSKRDKAKTATGGLLRSIGDFGIILCKDFGSVLSMNRDARASLLGAFREIFDGSWVRFVGTDGGKELRWSGRVGFIGGCTTDIDTHHSVMASMGERFVLYRLPEASRKDLSRMAVRQSRQSRSMRKEIADALVALFDAIDLTTQPVERTDQEVERLVCLADFVSMARSPVERDGYKREIELIPDPEAPTRIAKVLARLLDGLRAVGVDEDTAWQIIVKVSRDCVPVLRIKILDLMADGELRTTTKITNVIGYPRTTIGRCCEDLNAHRFLSRDTTGDSNVVNWQITIEGKERYLQAFQPAKGQTATHPEMSKEVQTLFQPEPPLKGLGTWTDISGQGRLDAEGAALE